jgi:hypothetical protein
MACSSPTTLVDDRNAYDRVNTAYGGRSPNRAHGVIRFAGNYWPPRLDAHNRQINSMMFRDVEFAIGEARAMIVKAYMTTVAAMKGDTAAEQKMERWFGPKQGNIIPVNSRRWWKGAQMIISLVEDFVVKNVDVYYRGPKAPDGSSLIGKANDYPGETAPIDAHDISGLAEAEAGAVNNRIGLCSDFWAKTPKGKSKMNRIGRDSVGGTLLHELSHNICSTDDHCTSDDTNECYGVANCEDLAENKASRAWYNADNIQYFCEDVYYGLSDAPKVPVRTGATRNVSQLKSLFGG